jgi:hypothetical protein
MAENEKKSEIDALLSQLDAVRSYLVRVAEDLQVKPTRKPGLGNRSLSFVQKMHKLAIQSPDSVSPLVDVEALGRNKDHVETLFKVEAVLHDVNRLTATVKRACGAAALEEANKQYHYLKLLDKAGNRKYRGDLEQVRFRYSKCGKRKKGEAASTAGAAPPKTMTQG